MQKEERNFLIACSNAVGGFWEQWVFLLDDMLDGFWNLLNQWFGKRKLWSGSNSSSICFAHLTNHHLFTGSPWCLIGIYSLHSFSCIDTSGSGIPSSGIRFEGLHFINLSNPSYDLKRPTWYYVKVIVKKLLLLGFNKKIWVRSMKSYVDKEFGIATIK